jgi:Sel1 repeat
MYDRSLFVLVLIFGTISALGQSQTIGPNGEGSFVAGPEGIPLRVLNEANSWSQPSVVFKNSKIEILIPDIRTAGWAQSYASAFKKEGTYFTYLYIYGIQSHRTIREALYVNTRTRIAIVVENALVPPTRVDLCKPNPLLPIDRITAIVKEVSDSYHGPSLDDAIAEQSYTVARMAACSESPNSEDCTMSDAEYRAKYPRYPRTQTPTDILLAQIAPMTARRPDESCKSALANQGPVASPTSGEGDSRQPSPNVAVVPLQNQTPLSNAENACNAGNPESCNQAAEYLQGQADSMGALNFYKKSCDDGSPVGCKSYAHLLDDLLNGTIRIGNLHDYQQAVLYNKKACEFGEVSACSEAGFLLSYASTLVRGVAPDDQEAIRYYNMACEGGVMNVCIRLGFLFEFGHSNLLADGQSVAKDSKQARSYWQKACDENDQDGCTMLKTVRGSGRF